MEHGNRQPGNCIGHQSLGKNPFSNAVSPPATGKEMEYMALMKYPDLHPLWKRGFGNEVGRLFQCFHNIQGSNTYFFIELKNIPKDRKITYGKLFCNYKAHKKEK
jgi:hypothetical protein